MYRYLCILQQVKHTNNTLSPPPPPLHPPLYSSIFPPTHTHTNKHIQPNAPLPLSPQSMILVTPLVRIMVSTFHLILFIILELTPDFDIGYELIYKGVKHFLFTFKLLPSMCDFFLNCTIKVFL